jgi:hypothetical protein
MKATRHGTRYAATAPVRAVLAARHLTVMIGRAIIGHYVR